MDIVFKEVFGNLTRVKPTPLTDAELRRLQELPTAEEKDDLRFRTVLGRLKAHWKKNDLDEPQYPVL